MVVTKPINPCLDRVKRMLNGCAPVAIFDERDDTGQIKRRPALRWEETATFPKNWDGIIKCKYSETSK